MAARAAPRCSDGAPRCSPPPRHTPPRRPPPTPTPEARISAAHRRSARAKELLYLGSAGLGVVCALAGAWSVPGDWARDRAREAAVARLERVDSGLAAGVQAQRGELLALRREMREMALELRELERDVQRALSR
jgi:hypothetical protein